MYILYRSFATLLPLLLEKCMAASFATLLPLLLEKCMAAAKLNEGDHTTHMYRYKELVRTTWAVDLAALHMSRRERVYTPPRVCMEEPVR